MVWKTRGEHRLQQVGALLAPLRHVVVGEKGLPVGAAVVHARLLDVVPREALVVIGIADDEEVRGGVCPIRSWAPA